MSDFYNLETKYLVYFILIILFYFIITKLIYINNNLNFYKQYNIKNNKIKKLNSIIQFSKKLFKFILFFDLKCNYEKQIKKIGYQYYIYLIFIKYTIKFIINTILFRFLSIWIFTCYYKKSNYYEYFIKFYFKEKYGKYENKIEIIYLFLTNLLFINFIKSFVDKIVDIYKCKIKIDNDLEEKYFWNNILIEKNNLKVDNNLLKEIIKNNAQCNDNDFEFIIIHNKSKYFDWKYKIKKIKEFNNNKKNINFLTKLIFKKRYKFKNINKFKEKLKKIEIKDSLLVIILFKNYKFNENFLKNIPKTKIKNINELIFSNNIIKDDKKFIKIFNNKINYYINFDINNLIFKNVNFKIIKKRIVRILLLFLLVLLIIFLSTPASILQMISIIFFDIIKFNIIPKKIRIFGQSYFFPTFLIIIINFLLILLIDHICKHQNHLKFSNYQLSVFQISFIYLFINIIFLPMLSLGYGETLFHLYKKKLKFFEVLKMIKLKNNKYYFSEYLFQSTFYGFLLNFSLMTEFFSNKFSFILMIKKRIGIYKKLWWKKEFDSFQIGYFYSNFSIIYFILILFGLYNTRIYFICFFTFFTRLISDSSMILCFYGKEFECNFKLIKANLRRIEISIISLNLFFIFSLYIRKNYTNFNKIEIILIFIMLIFLIFYLKIIKSKLKTSYFKINKDIKLNDNEIQNFKTNYLFQ